MGRAVSRRPTRAERWLGTYLAHSTAPGCALEVPPLPPRPGSVRRRQMAPFNIAAFDGLAEFEGAPADKQHGPSNPALASWILTGLPLAITAGTAGLQPLNRCPQTLASHNTRPTARASERRVGLSAHRVLRGMRHSVKCLTSYLPIGPHPNAHVPPEWGRRASWRGGVATRASHRRWCSRPHASLKFHGSL